MGAIGIGDHDDVVRGWKSWAGGLFDFDGAVTHREYNTSVHNPLQYIMPMYYCHTSEV